MFLIRSCESLKRIGIRFFSNLWWRYAGSNRRPPACKAGALPAELYPHIWIENPRAFKIKQRLLVQISPILTLDVKSFFFK